VPLAAMNQPLLLPRRAREVLLAIHIGVNAAWIGGVIAVLALQLAKRGVDVGADRAAFFLHDLVVTWASYLVIATALCFSLFTVWGFFRYWWLAAKWLGLALLGAALAFWQSAAVNEVAALSDVAAATATGPAGYQAATRAVVVSQATALLALLALVLLSTLKPWGRTPWDKRRSDGQRSRRRVLRATLVLAGAFAVAALATAQMRALERIRALPVPAVAFDSLADGLYRGSFTVLGLPLAVETEIRQGRVTALRPLDPGGGLYPRLARGIEAKIVAAQRLDVDGVTGATTTSRAYQLAAADALSRAPLSSP
jgi:uncharacterized protein with FMN-binding domain